MENLSNKDWSNLPVHKPDVDLWDRIDTELDLQGVSGNFEQLPKYSPKISLWNSISLKLTFNQYIKYFYFAGIGIITTVLFFVFINNSNNDNKEIKSIDKPDVLSINQNIKKSENYQLYKPAETGKKIYYKNTSAKTKDIQEADQVKATPVEENISAKVTDKTINNKTDIPKDVNIAIGQTFAAKQKILKIQQSENNVQIKTAANEPGIAPIISNQETKTAVSPLKSNNKNIAEKPDKIENSVSENEGIEPKKVNLKSTDQAFRKSYYTIGIDYTYNKIYNQEMFSYSDNKSINQYGLTFKYNFSNLFFQTGLNYSRFSDNFKYNSDQKLNQFKTYNYVDSVIYNPQGNIIQYITHPVTINDSVLYQQLINATKKYSLLNIPVILGYQRNFKKISVSFKAGILCSIVISEKETITLPENTDVSVSKIYSGQSSINKTNWAGILSAEIDYNFSKRWGISVEPVLQYYFNPSYNEMDLNSKSNKLSPYMIGIKTGLFFKF